MSSQRGYKIRSYVNSKAKDGSEHKNYSLTVPGEIAEALPADLKFVPKMTDEGLLFVPLAGVDHKIDLPEWAKGESNGGGKSKGRGKPKPKPAEQQQAEAA